MESSGSRPYTESMKSTQRTCVRCESNIARPKKLLCGSCMADNKLLKENLVECPESLEGPEMKQFIRKLAAHACASRTEDGKLITRTHMEASLMDVILRALPLHYVSTVKVDPDRSDINVLHTIKAPIPREVLYQVIEKLGIWTSQDPEEEDEEFA